MIGSDQRSNVAVLDAAWRPYGTWEGALRAMYGNGEAFGVLLRDRAMYETVMGLEAHWEITGRKSTRKASC